MDSSSGVPVQDIWLDYIDVNNQNTLITGYPTEKNINMLRRIIEASSNKGDIVLDCFAGSGTTLVAAEELGRQWIGVDIGDESIRTIEHRFQNGSKPMGDYTKKKESTDTPTLFDIPSSPIQEQTVSRNVEYDFYEEI